MRMMAYGKVKLLHSPKISPFPWEAAFRRANAGGLYLVGLAIKLLGTRRHEAMASSQYRFGIDKSRGAREDTG